MQLLDCVLQGWHHTILEKAAHYLKNILDSGKSEFDIIELLQAKIQEEKVSEEIITPFLCEEKV